MNYYDVKDIVVLLKNNILNFIYKLKNKYV